MTEKALNLSFNLLGEDSYVPKRDDAVSNLPFKRVPVWSLPPICSTISPSFEEILLEQESGGWVFVTLLPGRDAQHQDDKEPCSALFRKPARM